MRRFTTFALLALLISLLPAAVRGAAPKRAFVDWGPRLRRLDPARPMEYFRLAEEVSDRADDVEQRDLARHLFKLAAVLDESHLGRSACLALLDLAEEPHRRRRLQALADLLGRSAGVPFIGSAVVETDRVGEDPAATLAVAEAFSYFRRGEGQRALSALDDPAAMAVLESVGHLVAGGVERFLEDCRLYRSGQRTPSVGGDELTRMLRLEAALLAGDTRTWSADLMLNNAEPLIEVDPDELAATLGVDDAACVYRNGRWVKPMD